MAAQRAQDTSYAYDRAVEDHIGGGSSNFKAMDAYKQYRSAQTELSDALDRLIAAARNFPHVANL